VRPSAANDVLVRPVGDRDGDSLVARPRKGFGQLAGMLGAIGSARIAARVGPANGGVLRGDAGGGVMSTAETADARQEPARRSAR